MAGERRVTFDPALCTNCTLCLKVCPMAAITGRTLRGAQEALAGRAPLYTRALRQCPSCGAGFSDAAGQATVCPACANDTDMEEDWLDMLSG